MASTADRLVGFVNYHTSHPRNYTEQTEHGFRDYKRVLDAHLQGERGSSTLSLLFSNRVGDFNPQNVKMGLTASCPMSLRREIIAQHNYRANENRRTNEQRAATNDSIRVTDLMAGTLGMALSLTYRVARTAIRTIFSPITFLYSLQQQQRYGIKGWAKEDLKRVAWEWIDVGTTLVSFFAGVINTFHPNAIKLDSLRDYYVERTDRAIARNQEFAEAKKQYLQKRAETRAEENG